MPYSLAVQRTSNKLVGCENAPILSDSTNPDSFIIPVSSSNTVSPISPISQVQSCSHKLVIEINQTTSSSPYTSELSTSVNQENSAIFKSRNTEQLSYSTSRDILDHPTKTTKCRIIPYQLRITKMLVTVIGAFYLTFVTYTISSILLLSDEELLHNVVLQKAYNVGKILACLNSLANPCIYVWKDKAIRKAHKRLLCRCRATFSK